MFSFVVIAATLGFLLEQEGSKAMGVQKVNLYEGEWEKVLAWKAGVQRLCLGHGSIATGCGSLVNTLCGPRRRLPRMTLFVMPLHVLSGFEPRRWVGGCSANS